MISLFESGTFLKFLVLSKRLNSSIYVPKTSKSLPLVLIISFIILNLSGWQISSLSNLATHLHSTFCNPKLRALDNPIFIGKSMRVIFKSFNFSFIFLDLVSDIYPLITIIV